MKLFTVIFFSLISSAAVQAETHHLSAGQIFVGKEALNEKLTGNSCSIQVVDVQPIADKGLHCHRITYKFQSTQTDLPTQELVVDSRITNYHRAEYPKIKTCAMNVSGATSGDDIYGDDTTNLYNQIFGGMQKKGNVQYDYFLTLHYITKSLFIARVHVSTSSAEHDVDCVNLELQ